MEETGADGDRCEPSRLDLLRDVLVFQAKLALDGLLDFLLIPVSAAAAIVSFFERREDRDAFYRVVATGARADRWINLFGAGDRIAAARDDHEEGDAGLDVVVGRVEDYLRREYDAGRLPVRARTAIDRVVSRLREDTDRRTDEEDPGSDTTRP